MSEVVPFRFRYLSMCTLHRSHIACFFCLCHQLFCIPAPQLTHVIIFSSTETSASSQVHLEKGPTIEGFGLRKTEFNTNQKRFTLLFVGALELVSLPRQCLPWFEETTVSKAALSGMFETTMAITQFPFQPTRPIYFRYHRFGIRFGNYLYYILFYFP